MSHRITALSVLSAALITALGATDALATARATAGLIRASVSGSASTSGGVATYAAVGFVGLARTATSTGAAPPGTATATSTTGIWSANAFTAVTGTGAAGPENPFLLPIAPAMDSAECSNSVQGWRSGDMFTVSGMPAFSAEGGGLELCVLNVMGMYEGELEDILDRHYSVERAVASGELGSWRVLGNWRESSMTSGMPYTFSVDVSGISDEHIMVNTLTHSASIPAPGALALAGCGVLCITRRRRVTA
ncbi:MAG: hypothetical protein JNK25_14675 [Phycisphaerae bacterium]|nr:hypothetical protein [Phycisphaerae bacterium]